DVERAGNMTATKREHVAHINKDACLFFDRLFERLRRKSGNAWQISDHSRAFRVHFFHYRIVMWDRRRGLDCIIAEAFRVTELQKLIKFPLVTDGAAQPGADVCTAWGARAVLGVTAYVIVQLALTVPQRRALRCGS